MILAIVLACVFVVLACAGMLVQQASADEFDPYWNCPLEHHHHNHDA